MNNPKLMMLIKKMKRLAELLKSRLAGSRILYQEETRINARSGILSLIVVMMVEKGLLKNVVRNRNVLRPSVAAW